MSGPNGETTLLRVLLDAAEVAPDQVLVHMRGDGGERTVTYARLRDDALRVAGGYRAAGVAPGRCVPVLADRGDDFQAMFWDALAAGLVPVPLAAHAERVLPVWELLGRPPVAVDETTAALLGELPSDIRFLRLETLRQGRPPGRLPEAAPGDTLARTRPAARALARRLERRGIAVRWDGGTAPTGPPAPTTVLLAGPAADGGTVGDLDSATRALPGTVRDLFSPMSQDGARLVAVTEDVHATGAAAERLRPAQALLTGLALALPQEFPGLTAYSVDLSSYDSLDARLDALEREVLGWHAPGDGGAVAWRAGRRLVRTLAPVPTGPPPSSPLPPDGRYLITGGTGGIGAALARDLAGRGRPTLVLVGRSARPADRLLAELGALGATAEYRVADVSAEAGVEALMADLPPLDGVFHAAGVVRPGTLRTKSQEEMAEVMAAKVRGSQLLSRALWRHGHRPVVSVAFSSVAAVLPGLAGALGDYAAANAFLDAFAAAERASGRPWQSLNFAAFAETGMAAGEPPREHLRALLFPDGGPRLLEEISTPLGRSAFVSLPLFADELAPGNGLTGHTARAVAHAASLGARCVSLAGMIPAYTGYGFEVVRATSGATTVTTGHAATAVSVVKTVHATLAAAGHDLADLTVAMVGLGSIGTSSLHLLLGGAPRPPARLVLCDVAGSAPRLRALGAELRGNGLAGSVETAESAPGLPDVVYEADLIVTAVSGGTAILDVDRLRAGTVVVDDSFPHCFDTARALDRMRARRDVLTVGGGLLAVGDTERHIADDLPPAAASGYAEQTWLPGTVASCRLERLLHTAVPGLPLVHGLVDASHARAYWEAVEAAGVTAAPLHLLGHTVGDGG